MELDSWCGICGQQVSDTNSLYCSNECKNVDMGNSIPSQSQTLQMPPSNLQFSITITPNIFRASDSNARISTSSSASSSYTDSIVSSTSFTSLCTLDQNYDHVYNRCCKKYEIDDYYEEDNDHYTSYYSTSNPIDIPSPRTQAANDPALEPNNATFGKEKSIF